MIFTRKKTKRIFETIYSMFNGAQRIDPVTVLDMLTRMGYYDEAGGRAYLFQLMEVTPGARNVNEYVRIVRDKSLLRQLADAGERDSAERPRSPRRSLRHCRAGGAAHLQHPTGRELRACHGFLRLSLICIPNWTSVPGRTVKFPACPPASTRWTRR